MRGLLVAGLAAGLAAAVVGTAILASGIMASQLCDLLQRYSSRVDPALDIGMVRQPFATAA